MKKSIILILCALTAVSCSQIKGKGEITTISYNINNSAQGINISNAITLTLNDQLQPGELKITAHENIHSYIRISNQRDELTLRLEEGNYRDLFVIVEASSAQYNDIEASGACKISIKGTTPSFDDYSVELSGASRFTGAINASEELDIDLSGSSKVTITGSSKMCEAEMSGSSELSATGFTCNELEAEMSGSSKIKMEVTDAIVGNIKGSSSISYKGTPSISVETSGSASVSAYR